MQLITADLWLPAVVYVARSMVFGSRPLAPATFAAMAALLYATAWVALYLPARWASRLDPARILRGD